MESFQFSSYADEYTQLLTELHEAYCKDQPEDVLQYCSNFFNKKLEEQRSMYFRQQHNPFLGKLHLDKGFMILTCIIETERHPLADTDDYPTRDRAYSSFTVTTTTTSIDGELDDNFSIEPLSMQPNYNRGRRTSVSAESMAPAGNKFVKKIIPKTEAQMERIRNSVGNNFLFKNLDEEHHQDVVNAMMEMTIEEGKTIIEQGAVGDYFYIVDSGTFDCFITKDGKTDKVTSYETGGSFGELALMYNAPRAATIVATSDAKVWALDRVTFRTILMENTSLKRKMYESFLAEVPLLKSLESYERHKIADALESVYFQDKEQVMKQGDIGDQFYLIESGTAVFYKTDKNGEQQEVNQLGRGSYFGGNSKRICHL
ncbi:Putative cAMP-dependent protein kinase regulatory subunit [Rhizopus microsporus]|nr:Putative cAMP-dependent protein kinase regulatory subunit [Rhizopus microsporus]